MQYVIFVAVGLVAGVAVMAAIFSAANARYNRRKKARKTTADPPKAKRKIEFSKMILMLVMLTYFITVGVGIKLSFIDYTQYSTLAMLVGAPTATAIGFYAWKAKAENVVKIKKENPEETAGISVDLDNIQT